MAPHNGEELLPRQALLQHGILIASSANLTQSVICIACIPISIEKHGFREIGNGTGCGEVRGCTAWVTSIGERGLRLRDGERAQVPGMYDAGKAVYSAEELDERKPVRLAELELVLHYAVRR